jgi:hypothetical protein
MRCGGSGSRRDRVGPALAALDVALTEPQRRLIYFENSRSLLHAKGLP